MTIARIVDVNSPPPEAKRIAQVSAVARDFKPVDINGKIRPAVNTFHHQICHAEIHNGE